MFHFNFVILVRQYVVENVYDAMDLKIKLQDCTNSKGHSLSSLKANMVDSLAGILKSGLLEAEDRLGCRVPNLNYMDTMFYLVRQMVGMELGPGETQGSDIEV